jgi:hypothetical protein
MLLFALFLSIFALPYFAFNVGGSIPESGTGTTVTTPTVTSPIPPPVPPPIRGTASIMLKPAPVPTVIGSGFKPRESVRITGPVTVRVAASAQGTFTAPLRGVDTCGSITLTAVGSEGSRASVNYSQLLCVEE